MTEPEAPPSTGPVGERFRLGRVVARSFAIWGRELPLILTLTLVVHAPRVASLECLERVWQPPPLPEHRDSEALSRWVYDIIPISLTRWLLGTLFRDLSLAIVIFAVYARLQGRGARVATCVRGGLHRILPVLGVSLCLFVAGATLHWGATFLWIRVAFWGLPLGWLLWVPIWTPLVITLLLNPFWVAVPGAVVEERGKPLRRSWKLTRGHRRAVCAVLLLLYAIDWGSGRLLHLGLKSSELPWLAGAAIWWTQDLLVVSLSAVFAAVGYHALRLEKEGVDVSDLERVFA